MREISNLEELKKIELNILKYIDMVCKKYSIRYFLAYGTLIGAVRHKGFIPWDDDADIVMPRPDYEKFIKVMKKEKGIYRIICLEHCKKDYSYPFAKVIDSRTIINEPWRPMKEKLGVFVDVFPLDGIGNTEKETVKNAKILLKIAKLIWYIDTVKDTFKGRILNIIGRKNLNRVFKHIAKKNNYYKSKYVGTPSYPPNDFEIIKKEYYLESKNVIFEDYNFPIPKNYDIILKKIYGKYMEYPPMEERKPQHPYDAWWK